MSPSATTTVMPPRAANGIWANSGDRNKSVTATRAAPASPTTCDRPPASAIANERLVLALTANPLTSPAAMPPAPMPSMCRSWSTSSPVRRARARAVMPLSAKTRNAMPTAGRDQ